ncbi:MAG: hypothetical protein EWM51_09755 [Treponema sp.]|nr:MAG: hypothetical protein EWM51_09755 [Treponema sp.]
MNTNENPNKKIKHELSDTDREILASYKAITRGIGLVFGNCCEVTLHSIEDPSTSIIAIAHGEITGRAVGSPMTDLALEVLTRSRATNEDVIGPYFSTTKSGKRLRSVTTLIRNRKGELIGFLCVNFDLTAPLINLMDALLPSPTDISYGTTSENYSDNVGDLVHNAFVKALSRISQTTGVSPIEKNRMIVLELQNLGIFNVKGAVETVAGELGVSKFTVYNYLRDLRGRENEQERENG